MVCAAGAGTAWKWVSEFPCPHPLFQTHHFHQHNPPQMFPSPRYAYQL